MLRKAIYGLILVGVVCVLILTVYGVYPNRALALFSQPYEEALKEGSYIHDMVIRVPGDNVEGTQNFEMVVKNPTPRTLTLTAKWVDPRERCVVNPAEVKLQLDAGAEVTVRSTLTVSQPVRVQELHPPVLKGRWQWSTFAGQGMEPQPITVPVSKSLRVLKAFGKWNTVALVVYLVGILVIGGLASRHITGTRSYFIADGKVNPVIVGMSLLGTYLSAMTMLALSGMSFGTFDWIYTVQLPCLILTAVVITGYVMPKYREAGIVSIYEYLERRIDVSVRIIASACFVLFAIGRMGLLLYLPALAFTTVTGVPLWLAIIGMGVIITVYTVIGGIKAVIWTDAIQVVLFISAGFITLAYVFGNIGALQFIHIGVEFNKFRVLVPGFDPTKIVTAWLVLETIFQTIRIYGTQQDMAQRFLTTGSTHEASISIWIAILGYIPLGFIFYLIGTALFTFFKAHPAVVLPEKPDQIYPFFVIHYMPAGVAGIVIAAIFAAAMSSIDSLMNSNSTVCVEDFLKRFARTERPDAEYLRRARFLTLLWGTLAIVMALMFMEIRYAQIVWGKLMGVATNGMLGLMALAFIPVRINKWSAITGFVASYACLFIMMGTGVIFLLWPVIGNLVCFFVALLINPLYARQERRRPPDHDGEDTWTHLYT